MKIKGIIFDMDGIATDTERLHMYAHAQFMQRYGHDIDWRWFARYIGTPTRENIATFKKMFDLPGDSEDLYNQRDDILIEIFQNDPLEALPGFLEAVQLGMDRGLKLAICSSSSLRQIQCIMTRLCDRLPGQPAIQDVFDAVTHGDEVKHSKPQPDIYLLSCKRLGLEPSECIALEDSVPGVASAVAAGCTCIAVPQEEYSEGLDFSKAHFRAASITEVLANRFFGLLEDAPPPLH